MLSCTSVRVRARCLFSCSDQTHQGWLLFRRHPSVSIMTVRLTNVNLKSFNSPLPVGCEPTCCYRLSGIFRFVFALFAKYLKLFHRWKQEDETQQNYNLLYVNVSVQNITCWVTRPEIKLDAFSTCICLTDVVSGYFRLSGFPKMLIKTFSNLHFVYTSMHTCTVTELISLLPPLASCQFLVWCFRVFHTAGEQPLSDDLVTAFLTYFAVNRTVRLAAYQFLYIHYILYHLLPKGKRKINFCVIISSITAVEVHIFSEWPQWDI